MRIKLTVAQAGAPGDDLVVTADGNASVRDLAAALFRTDPRRQGQAVPAGLTLVATDVESEQRTLQADRTLDEAGLRSGSTVSLVTASERYADSGAPSIGTLSVVSGPDAGKSFPLRSGTNVVGRDRSVDVRLTDPMVSKFHAKVNVTDVVEVVDTNSSNGVSVRGDRAQRIVVRPEDIVTLGDTALSVSVHSNPAVVTTSSSTIAFNRSPRLDPLYEGVELVAPEPPAPPQAGRFPIVPLTAPVLMGSIMFLITRNPTSVIFVALSPLMLVGNFVETRMTGKRAFRQATANFRARLTELVNQLEFAAETERRQRRAEHPATEEVNEAVRALQPMTWTRRPEHRSFLEVRLGLGRLPSRNTVKAPTNLAAAAPELAAELRAATAPFVSVDAVPVVASLRDGGALGIAGPDERALGLAYATVCQLAGLHSPAEVVIAALGSARSSRAWDALKWLPHTSSEHTQLSGAHLASSAGGCVELVSQLEDLVETRHAALSGDEPAPLPAYVVLVIDDAPIERSRLVALAEQGGRVGVHVIWAAPAVDRLPAVCRTYALAGLDGSVGEVGYVDRGAAIPVVVERADPAGLRALCERLSAVVDAGVPIDDERDLPAAISYLQLAGLPLAESAEAVIDRWHETHSIAPRDGGWLPRRSKDYDLRALVGQSATGLFSLDLRGEGPHALVGGTTGAGKSEFLQSWILGMAASHGPDRVTFLLVDYKGGAAFSECVKLPHTVGLVTDLSPHLVRRALTSLNAELKFREHLLNRKKVKDLASLERTGDPDAPPSLVIVVDEFAALVTEVPEFVDGVVNVAQRGRSLGLHLVLATQRPTGVIKDNLRANTNLRIALRMADEADAIDVIGTSQAAAFDPGIPGRGVAKTGPGRITAFQTGYIGGYTTKEPPKPKIAVQELVFGLGAVREEPPEDKPAAVPDLGANDLQKLVGTIRKAASDAEVPPARKPWLRELSGVYDLAGLPTRRTDDQLVFGVMDDPANQSQPAIAFYPDRDGNMAIYGTGGAGKSTALRTLAIAAGLSVRGGPCHVYGLDFASRGLQMLEDLPHVGSIVAGDDNERVARLLGRLRAVIDERSGRYAQATADSITRYRELANAPAEPRVLLLVDGIGAFRQAYEVSDRSRLFDQFLSIAADGRAVGVHVIVTADRPGAVPAGLASSIQQRLVLRLTNDMDLTMLGAPGDGFAVDSPAGRGFLEGAEVQVGVFGGSANTSVQAAEVRKLAASMSRMGSTSAPPIVRLTDRVALSDLPAEVGGLPVLGVADSTLEPVGFAPGGTFIVSGPPGSGRTSTLATLALSMRRKLPSCRLAYFGIGRSPLPGLLPWTWSAVGLNDVIEMAGKLATEFSTPAAGDPPAAIFIESLPDFLNGDADFALQELVKVAKTTDVAVFVDGETASLNGSWPLLQAVKSGRHGLALQPDQMDGDAVFRTAFPRIDRREYPPGRALYVKGGKVLRLQVALPE